MRTRSSIIWKTPKEDMVKLVNESNTINDILRKLGYINMEGNHRTLKDRLDHDGIDIEKLRERGKSERYKHMKRIGLNNITKDEDIFITNSPMDRKTTKRRIIEKNLIDYKCKDCGNDGNWNSKKISLHLEHKNGIGNDNRLENLCFLCPNCHSQTSTYGGRNSGKKRGLSVIRTCPLCGDKKDRQADVCRRCYKLRSGETESRLPPSKEP